MIEDVRAWAGAHPDVLGVALVGSCARGDARPDSDIDLVIVCTSPQRWVREAGWLSGFGTVKRVDVEAWGRVTSLRAHYADGLEVEAGIADAGWAARPLDEGTRRVADDGLLVLFDRGGAFAGVG